MDLMEETLNKKSFTSTSIDSDQEAIPTDVFDLLDEFFSSHERNEINWRAIQSFLSDKNILRLTA
jgi:hypothetical protein